MLNKRKKIEEAEQRKMKAIQQAKEQAEIAKQKVIDQLYSDEKNELQCIEELVSKDVYKKYKQVLEPVRSFIISLMDQV